MIPHERFKQSAKKKSEKTNPALSAFFFVVCLSLAILVFFFVGNTLERSQCTQLILLVEKNSLHSASNPSRFFFILENTRTEGTTVPHLSSRRKHTYSTKNTYTQKKEKT